VIGGDCDNVLPHPTFAIYAQTNSTAMNARKGTRAPVKFDANANPARYVATAGEHLISIQAANYGNGVAGGQVYPAFGLSGDYIVQGEFDLNGQHYACTQKVEVRAPGIRAELCWDTVGGASGSPTGGNDIDLHFAQLQYKKGPATCPTHGWDITCPLGNTYEDCYWDPSSGCRDNSSSPGPDWGYAQSQDSACIGWSSKRAKPDATTLGCTNPRLDKDNVTCNSSIDDPTSTDFCGPENINLDNPNDGESFAIAVNHYEQHAVNLGDTSNAKPHVNLYCNGVRVVSVGYNPVTGQTSFPLLNNGGYDSTGDYWIVGTIKTHVTNGQITSCDVAPIPSHNPDPVRDGATQVCVESTLNGSTPSYKYTDHSFVEHTALQGVANGSIPTQPAQWCKH
jgi:hypothetical protein